MYACRRQRKWWNSIPNAIIILPGCVEGDPAYSRILATLLSGNYPRYKWMVSLHTADGSSHHPAKQSHWRHVERAFAIVGGLASLAAVVALVPRGLERLPAIQRHHEELIITQLTPGLDFDRMKAIIGRDEDYHEKLKSGRTSYVFDRPWEYIQMIVEAPDRVIAVGVHAKVASFKPVLPGLGLQLNASSFADEGDANDADFAVGASGFCGAGVGNYFEGYTTPHASELRSYVLGEISLGHVDQQVSPCPLLDGACRDRRDKHPNRSGLERALLRCINSTRDGQAMRASLVPSTIIITAPSQPIVEDMLTEPSLGSPYGS